MEWSPRQTCCWCPTGRNCCLVRTDTFVLPSQGRHVVAATLYILPALLCFGTSPLVGNWEDDGLTLKKANITMARMFTCTRPRNLPLSWKPWKLILLGDKCLYSTPICCYTWLTGLGRQGVFWTKDWKDCWLGVVRIKSMLSKNFNKPRLHALYLTSKTLHAPEFIAQCQQSQHQIQHQSVYWLKVLYCEVQTLVQVGGCLGNEQDVGALKCGTQMAK